MIEFLNFQNTVKFRYLWLKYVTGVNLNVHCAQSLKGDYSKKFKPDLREEISILLDEHPAEILYLCGVSSPYKWENNVHLALKREPGISFLFNQGGISMLVRHAVRLPIETTAALKINHPKLADPHFSTCRNWQFANYLQLTKTAATS